MGAGSIPYNSSSNTSGGEAIYFASVDSVLKLPLPFKNALVGAVEFNPGESFAKTPWDAYDIELEIEKKSKSGLEFFEHTVKVKIPKQRQDALNTLMAYNNQKVYVLFETNNKDFRFLGFKNNPLRLNWSSTTGKGLNASNDYALEFKWVSKQEAPFYGESVIPSGCGPVTINVDGEFYTLASPGSTVNINCNSVFREHYSFANPSGLNVVIEDFPIKPISNDLEINSIDNATPNIQKVEYSFDGSSWQELVTPLTISAPKDLYIRAIIDSQSTSGSFTLTGLYT